MRWRCWSRCDRLPVRRARRNRLGRSGRRPAARAMLRRALSTGGEALRWRWLRRTVRPRPMVLVCDISGSMERYSRFMLRFAHALQRSGAPLEVFVFGTRLTRITRQLRSAGAPTPRSGAWPRRWWTGAAAPASARACTSAIGAGFGAPSGAARARGWSRTGGSAETRPCWRARWARSGGRATGCCGIDPLAARPGFEPVTVGLQAALPYVDEVVPAASVSSLEDLARRRGAM